MLRWARRAERIARASRRPTPCFLFPVPQATEYHLGQLKAKLAKLRTELQAPAPGAGKGGGEGFEVPRFGDARLALIGFPSVGKSTLLTTLTGTQSEVAAYEFTTLARDAGGAGRREGQYRVPADALTPPALPRPASPPPSTTATPKFSSSTSPASSRARRTAAGAGGRSSRCANRPTSC